MVRIQYRLQKKLSKEKFGSFKYWVHLCILNKTKYMNNMEKEFVTQEESFELKVLGFDEPCFGLFTRDNTLLEKWMPNQTECETYFGGFLAPIYQQAFRWFRDKYGLKISFAYWNGFNGFISEGAYRYECYVIPQNGMSITVRGEEDNVYFKTSEEAELACIKKLIQIVKKK